MNINIATFFYGNNYGALLQSYYLKKFLEKKYLNKNINFYDYQPKKLILREEYAPIIKKNPKKIFEGIIRFYKLRNWKNTNIRTKPAFKKKINTSVSHLSIYGSDEIWNFSNPFFGYDDYFFGKNDKNFKISYAATFGRANPKNLKKDIKSEMKKFLEDFSFISVRDEYSWKILKFDFGINSEIVLDPTFLIEDDFEKFENQIQNKNNCIIYGNYFSKQQIQKILKFCNENKLKLLSIGYYNNWAENNIKLNPFEFLQLLKSSKIFFTSMFHGVQFAVKFNLNFWYSIDPYRFNKLNYFLKVLNLKNREIKDNSNFNEEIDFMDREIKLDKWKKFSREFLINSIDTVEKKR